jgi:predicted nucleic acid-binding protein
MKIVIADTGVLISLGIVDKIEIIKNLFDEFFIPLAVWEELEKYENPAFPKKYKTMLKKHILQKISFLC